MSLGTGAKCFIGSRIHKPKGSDIHGNPGSRNQPQNQPLTGTVTLNSGISGNNLPVPDPYLPPREINKQPRGREGKRQESTKIR